MGAGITKRSRGCDATPSYVVARGHDRRFSLSPWIESITWSAVAEERFPANSLPARWPVKSDGDIAMDEALTVSRPSSIAWWEQPHSA